jgi:hypothetical protein
MAFHEFRCSNPKCGIVTDKLFWEHENVLASVPCECGSPMNLTGSNTAGGPIFKLDPAAGFKMLAPKGMSRYNDGRLPKARYY